MSSHYFDKEPKVPLKEYTVSYTINGYSFNLLGCSNVFSKNGLDTGSAILLKITLPLIKAGRVLDIGCGYGAIGLTLATLTNDIHVVCTDINLRAIDVCIKNARALELSKKVTVLQSDLFEKIEGKFDYIISNPPIRAGNKVLHKLYDDASDHLNPNGSLFLVVRRKQGAESTVKYLHSKFVNVNVLHKEKGYWVIEAKF